MRFIKNYQLFKESLDNKKGNDYIISDLCIAMLLLNPNFLDKLLDRGDKARYTEDSNVFLNDLKNFLFGNNRLNLGRFEDGKCVIDSEVSRINNEYNSTNFDIERDWSKLVNARIIARNIQDTLLGGDKLVPEFIKYIFWIGPNKTKYNREDIVIETTDGIQYPIYINKKVNFNKTSSFNSIAETLLRGYENQVYNGYIKEWDTLTREWVKIIYENANQNIRLQIEKFIDQDDIESLNLAAIQSLKQKNSNFQFIGEYFKEFDKYILTFAELLNEIYKNASFCFKDPKDVINKWESAKLLILNSNILEHLHTEVINSFLGNTPVEKLEDGFIKADGKLKKRFIKTIVDMIGSTEKANYFVTTNSLLRMPERDFFRNNTDNFELEYYFHTELTPDENIDNNTFNFSIRMKLNNEKFIDVIMATKMSGGEMSGKLSTKTSIDFSDKINFIK